MRRLAPLAVLLAAALAASAALAQSRPPKLEPLPEPPPPPPIPGPADPAVRIPVQEGDKVEEVRDNGRVIAIRVTPPGGKPYYLIDPNGTGALERRDSLDTGVRVPMWPIKTFD
ncbi:MAG: DUF2782 domain-containing protein [Clostridia bacterium]